MIGETKPPDAPPPVDEKVLVEAKAKEAEKRKKEDEIEEQHAKDIKEMEEVAQKEDDEAHEEIEKAEKAVKEAATKSPEEKKAAEKAVAVAKMIHEKILAKKAGVKALSDREKKKLRKPKLQETKMSRDGKMKFEFDHVMKVPDFLIKKRELGDNRRHLIALNELEVTRDLLELTFIMKSDVDPKEIGYNIILNEWTASHIDIKLNFTNPELLSIGAESDTVFVKIKDPSLFVSAETGKVLDLAGKTILKQVLPRQIPKKV